MVDPPKSDDLSDIRDPTLEHAHASVFKNVDEEVSKQPPVRIDKKTPGIPKRVDRTVMSIPA